MSLNAKAKVETWQAFKNHWILWKCFGLQPPKRDSKWFVPYIAYAIFLNVTVTLLFPTTLIVNLILSKNLTELCENLYMTTTDVICNVKFLNIFVVRHKLLKVRKILQRLDVRAKTHKEVAILEEGIKLARKCFMTFARLFCCAVISSQMMVYLSSERILMYPAWYPWDWRASKKNYIYAFSYQLYGLIVQSTQNLGNDTYPPAYLIILTAQIKALASRIKDLGTNKNTSEEELYKELTDCINDHNTINELFFTIQEVISTTCIAQFVATGLAQCTIGVYMIYVGLHPSKTLNIVIYFSAVTMEIFILCYFGDLYCQANIHLTEAIYACNWMDRDKKFKQAFLVLLQRSQKTNCIMAGNLIPVRMPTFVKVMKTAYSVFTVLNKVE
ncbi:odorant receptor 2a-like [Lucilia cuprina]|uniref:odorant receptor 2a-like n=1 Tax=Lucilia cuprina TaxID=7375 RepID=UPI001F06D52F|nr:odorant receptor 2a-like [Lucilia cuprina]